MLMYSVGLGARCSAVVSHLRLRLTYASFGLESILLSKSCKISGSKKTWP